MEIESKDPVKNKKIKKLIDFNEPLDTEQEFESIVAALKKIKKQFSVQREVATYNNLLAVMSRHPKVIHISCHGDCYIDSRTKKNVFYLAFEEPKRYCVLDKLDEERLTKLLGNE